MYARHLTGIIKGLVRNRDYDAVFSRHIILDNFLHLPSSSPRASQAARHPKQFMINNALKGQSSWFCQNSSTHIGNRGRLCEATSSLEFTLLTPCETARSQHRKLPSSYGLSITDPVWYWPDPDPNPTFQDKPDPDPWFFSRQDPDPGKNRVQTPDPDISALKIFHLFNNDFYKKLLPFSFFDGP